MFHELHIQGYKTLRDVELTLGSLNVLIGPNGCGKTNLLEVIALLQEHAAGKLEDAVYAKGGLDGILVLYHLFAVREYRQAYEDILDVIRTAYPEFEELSFPPEGGDGRIVMRWKEESFKRDFSTHYLSDGILRFLCLLAILKTPDPPLLVCIDEPELGLHPSLMPIIAALLRDASSRTQLIVATHSPQLVDALDVEHIVVMEKVDGATQVQRLADRPQLDAWLEHYSKGELWLSGELGGVP